MASPHLHRLLASLCLVAMLAAGAAFPGTASAAAPGEDGCCLFAGTPCDAPHGGHGDSPCPCPAAALPAACHAPDPGPPAAAFPAANGPSSGIDPAPDPFPPRPYTRA